MGVGRCSCRWRSASCPEETAPTHGLWRSPQAWRGARTCRWIRARRPAVSLKGGSRWLGGAPVFSQWRQAQPGLGTAADVRKAPRGPHASQLGSLQRWGTLQLRTGCAGMCRTPVCTHTHACVSPEDPAEDAVRGCPTRPAWACLWPGLAHRRVWATAGAVCLRWLVTGFLAAQTSIVKLAWSPNCQRHISVPACCRGGVSLNGARG